jgi:hypothetical protein
MSHGNTPLEAQRINLLILNGSKRGWVVKDSLLPLYLQEIKLFSNLQEAG